MLYTTPTQSSKACAWLYNPPTFSPLVRFSTSPLSMPSVFRIDSLPSDIQNPRSMPLQLFYRTRWCWCQYYYPVHIPDSRATRAALPLPERQWKHQSDNQESQTTRAACSMKPIPQRHGNTDSMTSRPLSIDQSHCDFFIPLYCLCLSPSTTWSTT